MPPTIFDLAGASTISAFVAEMTAKPNLLWQIANNVALTFGTDARPYLLANYLPVQLKDTNEIYESLTRTQAAIANDGAPLSPPQMKRIMDTLSFRGRLGHIDLAAQMDAREMTELSRLLGTYRTNRSEAESYFIDWLVRNIRIGLEMKAEKQRAECLAYGFVRVEPANAPEYVLQYPTIDAQRVTIPSGSVVAPQGFYSPTYDPIANFFVPAKQMLNRRGYEVVAIITTTRIASALQLNPNIAKYGAGLIAQPSQQGQSLTFQNRPFTYTDTTLNAILNANGLPGITRYDRFFPLQGGGQARIFPEDAIVIIGGTGVSQQLVIYDDQDKILQRLMLTDTLGYYGRGVCLGESQPGTVITTRVSDVKPKTVYAEGYCEALPVLISYDAIVSAMIPIPSEQPTVTDYLQRYGTAVPTEYPVTNAKYAQPTLAIPGTATGINTTGVQPTTPAGGTPAGGTPAGGAPKAQPLSQSETSETPDNLEVTPETPEVTDEE